MAMSGTGESGMPGAAALIDRLAVLLLCAVALLFAGAGSANAADDYLDPDSAFGFTAELRDAKTIAISYAIAEGYYMYRERFAFRADGATLGSPIFPAGKVKFDETFNRSVETYRHAVTILIPVESRGPFSIVATSQGCADRGLCYAPMEKQAQLSIAGNGLLARMKALGAAGAVSSSSSAASSLSPSSQSSAPGIDMPATVAGPSSDVPVVPPPKAAPGPVAQDADGGVGLASALRSGRLLTIVPLFMLLGLGLAFTPCVLPMVPILSSIIVGEGIGVSRAQAFLLSVAYSLGMAIVYTALGVAAGLAGEGLAASLQNPWMLGAFGLLMVALSLSMFGLYTLQMPGAVQDRLSRASQGQRAGRFAGVFIMGALSALIVGPCVAAPLAGALVYISRTRDVVIGGSALFALAVGMSLPLLLVGLSAGALLPRAGLWMDAVKRLFGVLMLGMALWMVSPLLPVSVQMAGWALLGIGYGAYLLRPATPGWLFKAVGVIAVTLGLVQLAGVATGGRDVLQPLAHLGFGTGPQKSLAFARIKSSAQLDALLANGQGKTFMLDFYADWCVSCKEMEKLTFTDPGVQRLLGNTILLQADVTANDADDRALLKRFGLFGPPGIILFDKAGREISGGRVIGYQNSQRFTRSLAVLAPS